MSQWGNYPITEEYKKKVLRKNTIRGLREKITQLQSEIKGLSLVSIEFSEKVKELDLCVGDLLRLETSGFN